MLTILTLAAAVLTGCGGGGGGAEPLAATPGTSLPGLSSMALAASQAPMADGETAQTTEGTDLQVAQAASAELLRMASDAAAPAALATTAMQADAPGAAVPQAGDTIALLDAAQSMPSQTWNGINCHGRVGSYSSLPDTAISGDLLADGSTLRFGRTVDPLAATRRAFVFRVATQDTLFADSRRCEAVAFPNAPTALPQKQNFWYSLTLLVDQGGLSHGDDQLITQWHTQGYNPFMGLYLSEGKLRLTIRHSSALAGAGVKPTVLTPWLDSSTVQRRWVTFVFNGRISPFAADNPYLRVWRDGSLLLDYSGPIGYNSAQLPYAKIGFYSWNDGNNWDSASPIRSVYVRRAAILRDTGSRFSEASVRSWTER